MFVNALILDAVYLIVFVFVVQHNSSRDSSEHDSSSQGNKRNINCTLTNSVVKALGVVVCKIYP